MHFASTNCHNVQCFQREQQFAVEHQGEERAARHPGTLEQSPSQ